jgi:peroxiredoxin
LVVGIILLLIAGNVWYALSRGGDLGAPAPGFTLPRFDPPADQPAEVSLRDLRGKVVVLDFWATWCPSCVRGLPELEALYQSVDPTQVAVFAVNGEGKPNPQQAVRRFIDAKGYQVPVLIDNGSVFNAFDVRGIPQTVIIDQEGRVRAVHHGVVSRGKLAEDIARLLRD